LVFTDEPIGASAFALDRRRLRNAEQGKALCLTARMWQFCDNQLLSSNAARKFALR
jgi:hypothetical protein